jgi:hypothetical protein
MLFDDFYALNRRISRAFDFWDLPQATHNSQALTTQVDDLEVFERTLYSRFAARPHESTDAPRRSKVSDGSTGPVKHSLGDPMITCRVTF